MNCLLIAQRVAGQEGIDEGYRIATNIGSQGGQAIPHLHFHVLGGKQLGSVDGT
ncbi:MAG: HIT domain-containing protein [Actinomycetota bacterium]|nr:HIT domain-containing protein [Actinomycetota bacterium]